MRGSFEPCDNLLNPAGNRNRRAFEPFEKSWIQPETHFPSHYPDPLSKWSMSSHHLKSQCTNANATADMMQQP